MRLEEEDAERAAELLRQYEGAFVELTLRLKAPLTSSETQMLRAANEGLVSLIVRTQARKACLWFAAVRFRTRSSFGNTIAPSTERIPRTIL